MPVKQLVRLTSLFGLEENATRVALSRMVAAGELTTDGHGIYRLAGALEDRQRRQAQSRAAIPRPFDGRWHVLLLEPGAAPPAERITRRKALVRARLAEQREGVWLRPANLPLEVPASDRAASVRLLAVPDGDPALLTARLFDLEGWAQAAADLEEMMRSTTVATPDDLARGFVVSAAVLRHLQADPLLPSDLLPADWPGSRLRAAYGHFDRRYRENLAAFHREQGDVTSPSSASP